MAQLRNCCTIGLLALLAGCNVMSPGDDQAAGSAPPVSRPAAIPADDAPDETPRPAEQLAWQKARVDSLTAADGWTSLIALYRVDLKSHFIGSSGGTGMRLAFGPPRLGLLQQSGGGYWFTPERGVAVTLDGNPVQGRVRLYTDADDQPTPGTIGFDDGKGAITLIKRGGVTFLRARHEDAPARAAFSGIDYWPYSTKWQVEATFEPGAEGATLPIASLVGVVEDMPTPGTVTFERDGMRHSLQALANDDGSLFLIFADRTSGHGSYSAGRYLDAPAPDADGHVRLDFNQSYNPPCAFTDFATCPLPPDANRLDLAVPAGEKAYHAPEAQAAADA